MQQFNRLAGTAIIPTLARIALFLAFISVGANKLFKDATFSHEEAQRLHELKVSLAPVEVAGQGRASGSIRQAAFTLPAPDDLGTARPDDPPRNDDPPVDDPPNDDPPVDEPPVDEPPIDEPPAVEPEPEPEPEPQPEPELEDPAVLPPGEYRATSLHRITLIVDDAGWSYPVFQGYAAAFVETIGAALVLVGVFTRLWGLLLAATMVAAFYLVSMNMLGVHTMSPFAFAENTANFNTVCSQIGMFILAFGVFLTGAGPLSVDRLLFPPNRVEDDE